ncbi:MAG: hypothetical protein H7066_22425 [Cytophagaceae bacterium]|nr:hypothetical protein [Gemmatimonadaceae bacterium]
MPRLEDLDLGHDPIREAGGRGQQGKGFEPADDRREGIVPGLTVGTLLEVRPEGRNAETLLVIEEEIDLVW